MLGLHIRVSFYSQQRTLATTRVLHANRPATFQFCNKVQTARTTTHTTPFRHLNLIFQGVLRQTEQLRYYQ
jgi:hypothetical protein